MQSDKRLLKLFRRGVGPAFDELVSRYRAPLVGYAGAIVGRDRAEDVVQDSLIKAHKALLSEQDIEPKPWLYKVVRNTALNDIRDNKKHGHDELDETTVGVEQPQQIAERRAELAGVVAAISELPEAQRKALIGRELSGFSHEEIASELSVSTGATKQLIHRARLNVRNAMGALIPIPLIAWLAASGSSAAGGAAGAAGTAAATGSGAAGAGTTGATAAVAAGGTAATTAGTAGGGAAAGGALAGLGGAGLAKVAVVAVVAGGGIAGGGIAVKRSAEKPASADTPALEASSGSSIEGEGESGGSAAEPKDDSSGNARGEDSGRGPESGSESSAREDLRGDETLGGKRDESFGGGKGGSGGGGNKPDKPGKGGSGGGGNKPDKPDKPDKGGSGGGGNKHDKPDKPDKGGSGGGGNKHDKPDKPDKGGKGSSSTPEADGR